MMRIANADSTVILRMCRGGFGMSPRGCSCFGERSMDLFLNKYNFQHVFRVRGIALSPRDLQMR